MKLDHRVCALKYWKKRYFLNWIIGQLIGHEYGRSKTDPAY